MAERILHHWLIGRWKNCTLTTSDSTVPQCLDCIRDELGADHEWAGPPWRDPRQMQCNPQEWFPRSLCPVGALTLCTNPNGWTEFCPVYWNDELIALLLRIPQ